MAGYVQHGEAGWVGALLPFCQITHYGLRWLIICEYTLNTKHWIMPLAPIAEPAVGV